MEESYPASKSSLLKWLAADFGLNVKKIEDCGNGVPYLVVMKSLSPENVPMHRVKMNATQEWERLHNLKILQTAFTSCNIQKQINLDRLSKCLYLDNLALLQWMKRLFDRYNSQDNMDSVHAIESQNTKNDLGHFDSLNSHHSPRSNISKYSSAIKAAPVPLTPSQRSGQTFIKSKSNIDYDNKIILEDSFDVQCASTAQLKKLVAKLKETIANQAANIEAMTHDMIAIEEERRFFFRKLRKIELMTNQKDIEHLDIDKVQQILFEADEALDEELYEENDNTETLNTDENKKANQVHPTAVAESS